MKKEFVPYEQALELKALGFDGDCFAIWSGFDEINFSTTDKARLYSSEFRINDPQSATFYTNDFNSLSRRVSAPTFSQAFRWFREEYKIECYVNSYWNENDSSKRTYYANYNYGSDIFYTISKEFETHEEAELECLKKLIEIVKNGKK